MKLPMPQQSPPKAFLRSQQSKPGLAVLSTAELLLVLAHFRLSRRAADAAASSKKSSSSSSSSSGGGDDSRQDGGDKRAAAEGGEGVAGFTFDALHLE